MADKYQLKRISTQDDFAADNFECSIKEYSDYLRNDALRYDKEHIAATWVLYDRSSHEIGAYMSLITDAIRLSVSEMELHNFKIPFRTLPAMKLAKLAVSNEYRDRGLGSRMIGFAARFALDIDQIYSSCHFLTVDVDVEHDKDVIKFYEKNGFVRNEEYHSRTKQISMRRNIFG